MANLKCLLNLPTILFLCFVYLPKCMAVIYQLNDTEYKKMPPVFHVDPYEECMEDPDGVYCLVEVPLVSDTHSSLMELITEYSAHTVGHYNHSLLRYNLCITNMCKEFYHNTTTDLVQDVEACLNKTFEENYGLKTKLLENNIHCKESKEKIKTEIADLFMFALLIGIFVINTVGSLYDFICTNGKQGEGFRLLTSFSIRRNWRKLVAPPCESPDSRLICLSCLKVISTALVVMAHTCIFSIFYIENTKFMEDLYRSIILPASATIVVQTFFLVSGFLFSYNHELKSERNGFKVNWMLVPKGIVDRWIRLTPSYAFMLFFTVTISKYIITGPHWHYIGTTEIVDCKRYWWQHLLYINNYNDVSQCMPHTWYLACDMQLCALGLLVYVLCRSASSRKVVLGLLMVIAIIIPVGHTYWQDLDGILIASPEAVLQFFISDRTFTHLYKRGHTNMFSFFVGLSVGFLAYYGQKVDCDAQKYRKYRILFYSMIPLGVALILSGSIFYRDGPRPSLAVRMLFTAYEKPVWGLFIGIAIMAAIFKYERLVRGVMEWSGWTVLSRLSYCVYLLHALVIRVFVSNTDVTRVTLISMMEHMFFSLVVVYLAALPAWLLLEQPVAHLVSALLCPKTHGQDTDKSNNQATNKEEDKNSPLEGQLTGV